MRILAIMLVVLVSSTSIFAQKNAHFVQPKQDDAALYKNRVRKAYEKSIATVSSKERLKVLKKQSGFYQVRTSDGTIGWIEASLVANASGKSFMFDDANVTGYLDDPTPIFIIDADNRDGTPIKLERSFAEALTENLDRETIERLEEE